MYVTVGTEVSTRPPLSFSTFLTFVLWTTKAASFPSGSNPARAHSTHEVSKAGAVGVEQFRVVHDRRHGHALEDLRRRPGAFEHDGQLPVHLIALEYLADFCDGVAVMIVPSIWRWRLLICPVHC